MKPEELQAKIAAKKDKLSPSIAKEADNKDKEVKK